MSDLSVFIVKYPNMLSNKKWTLVAWKHIIWSVLQIITRKGKKRGKTSWLMDESFLERELTFTSNGVGVENTIFRYVSET